MSKIIFFICLVMLGIALIYIGVAAEVPGFNDEGTICEDCNIKSPNYIPKDIQEKIMEVIK